MSASHPLHRRRLAGVILHPTSLPARPGGAAFIGDLGPASREFMDWMRSDSTDSMTITGLSLVRDTAYYTFIKAVDLATNESFTARTDGIYFDNSFPSVNSITPDFISDSAGFLSVLSGDTIKINFDRSIYSYDLGVNSSVETEFLPTGPLNGDNGQKAKAQTGET